MNIRGLFHNSAPGGIDPRSIPGRSAPYSVLDNRTTIDVRLPGTPRFGGNTAMLALDTQPADLPRTTLRWYQREAVDKTIAALDAGHPDVLNVIATGGGKTNVALE